MTKIIKRTGFSIVLFLLLFLGGCSKKIDYKSIILNDESFNLYYEIGSTNLDEITFTITLENDEELIVRGSDFSISNEDMEKLNIPGEHTIALNYKDILTYDLTLTIVSSEEYHTFLSIYQMGLAAGAIDISYEEWLNSIRGEDGKDGKKIYLQVATEHIQYQYENDSTWTNLISLDELIGPKGEDGKKINLQVLNNYIQYQYEDDEAWVNLISLDDLMGDDGTDGREVMMQVSRTHIQWKYLDESTWRNLIELDTLTGMDGIGISDLEINHQGELIVTYTNNESFNLGKINVYHTIKFVGHGGYLIDFIHVLPNEEFTYPTPPLVDGYTFTLWDEDMTETTSDLTIQAIYQKNTYTLTFDSKDGSSVDPMTQIEHGSIVNLPIPLKEGYVFKGWFTGNSINDSQFTNTSLITSNLTLYARWEIGIYTVKFVNIENHVFDEIAVSYGESVTPPSAPSVTGYTFIQWSESLNDIKENLIAKAIYQINSYTISFDTNDGSMINPITEDYQTPLFAPSNPTKAGYSFMGWYLDETFLNPYTFTNMPSNDFTLYAKWQINQYVIEYELNDGINAANPSTYTIETPNITLLNPTKLGYTFDGWYNNSLFDGESIDTIFIGSLSDLVLYAKWIINSYDLSYEIVTSDYSTATSIYLEPNETIIKIFAGDTYSSLFTSMGRIFMWGYNGSGQLGIGTRIKQLTPIDITEHFSLQENEVIIKVAYGEYHASAITSLNRIFMWGENMYSQLGDGTTEDKLTPIDITSQFTLNEDEIITEMFLGNDVSSAITSTNRIFMWGNNNYDQLADGTGVTRRTPVDMTSYFNLNPLESITNLTFSLSHSVAHTSLGRVLTWGNNSFGQLGDGTTINKTTPTNMTTHFNLHLGETIVYAYAGGRNYSAALTSESRVFMWGQNDDAQLGDNTKTYKTIPTEITSHFNLTVGESITSLGIGKHHNTAISSNNRIFTWGYNMTIQLGDYGFTYKMVPTDDSSYFNLNDQETIIQMTIGEGHTFFLTSEKRLIIWGSNYFGQLGDGTTTQRSTPIELITYTHLSPHVETYDYDTDINPYLISKDGYQFNGWYSDMILNTPYTFTTMPANDLYVYGSWIPILYDISYVLNEGTHTGNPVTYTIESSNITLNQPTKTGYQFNGWYSDMILNTPYTFTTMPANDLYVYGSWIPILYDISYVLNEGTHTGNPVTYTIESSNITLNQPTKTGYQFDGWYDNSSFNGIPITTIPHGSMGDLTLYAKWSINSYTITFDSNEGSLVDPITQNYLITVIEPVEPTRLNYTFDGWFTDEALTNPYTFTTMPAQNITLYAKWLSNDPNIEYTTNSSSISIDQYIGNTRNYDIPSTIDSLPVTEIKALAFSNAMSLEILYIPSSVTTIGENAFQSSNPNLVILTPHLSQPAGWDVNFNPDNRTIIYGYSEPEPIDSISSKIIGEEVYIQGVYTGYTTSSRYFIQDDTGGIFLFTSLSTIKDILMNLEPGVEVYVKGIYNYSTTYTYITINSLDDFAIINETPNLPEVVDLSSLTLTSKVLSSYNGQLVSLSDYLLKESVSITPDASFAFILTNGTYDITVYVDSFIDDYSILAYQLNGTSTLSTIHILKGVVSRVNDTYRIELFGNDILITDTGK